VPSGMIGFYNANGVESLIKECHVIVLVFYPETLFIIVGLCFLGAFHMTSQICHKISTMIVLLIITG
jgi:hypothetical protein